MPGSNELTSRVSLGSEPKGSLKLPKRSLFSRLPLHTKLLTSLDGACWILEESKDQGNLICPPSRPTNETSPPCSRQAVFIRC